QRSWWTLLLRGLAAIAFAMLLIFLPGMTLATGAISLTIAFGIYALADGVFSVVGAFRHREGQWYWILLLGIVSIVAGLVALANPMVVATITVTLMIYIVAFRAIAGGILEIVAAWRLRQEMDGEWLLLLDGLFSIIFGIILFTRPGAALEVLLILLTFYLLVIGTMQIVLAFKVRGWAGKLSDLKEEASAAA
ncbi:MAG: DUF308 domain-containing protein, partial [Chloroflexota bacterium]